MSEAAHGTSARWHAGCHCSHCRRVQADAPRARGRARAQKRLPARCGNSSWTRSTRVSRSGTVLDDLGLTPNQVWGLTRTDPEWATTLETALTATRRDDLEHGTNAA